jgi:hypothetical protein
VSFIAPAICWTFFGKSRAEARHSESFDMLPKWCNSNEFAGNNSAISDSGGADA